MLINCKNKSINRILWIKLLQKRRQKLQNLSLYRFGPTKDQLWLCTVPRRKISDTVLVRLKYQQQSHNCVHHTKMRHKQIYPLRFQAKLFAGFSKLAHRSSYQQS